MRTQVNRVNKVITDIGMKFDQIINPEIDTVFTSGSQFEGFGNETSDIDLFIISNASPDAPSEVNFTTNFGFYVDVTFYKHEYVKNLISSINNTSPNDFDKIRSFSNTHLDQYYRIVIAEPIINPDIFNSIRAGCTKETLGKIYEVHSGLACQSALARTELWLQEHNEEAAYFSVIEAIGFALDSMLTIHGEAYVSPSWRFEKLARAFGRTSDLYCKAWKFKSLGDNNIHSFISECKEFCRELGMDRFPQTLAKVPKYKQVANTDLMEAGHHCYLIRDKTYIYDLNNQTRFLWSVLKNPCTEKELSSHISKELNLNSESAASLTSDCLKTLQMYNLVRQE